MHMKDEICHLLVFQSSMYVVPETILGMRILEFSGMVGYSKFGQT
jgi:hypothetical protein